MADWTDLSAAFAYGTKLTSTQQQQLRDNVIWAHDIIPNSPGLNGQIPIGQTGAQAAWKTPSGFCTVNTAGVFTGVNTNFQDYIAGDYREINDPDEEISGAGSTTLTKCKAFKIPKGGTLRVKFDMKMSITGGGGYGQVYRNGAAVSSLYTETGTGYVTKSEDVASWSQGDACQLYFKTAGAGYCYVKNFAIYAANPFGMGVESGPIG